jgi:hypothetical protein
LDPVGGQIQPEQVGSAIDRRLHYDASFLDRFPISGIGVVGVGLDTDPADHSAQLAGGETGRGFDDPTHHFSSRFF